MQNHRIRILKGFILFLAFMLCCTIISRGIYAYWMPQVEMGRAERKSIEHAIASVGNVHAVSEKAVILPAGIRIDEICVSTGEKVSADTLLLQLNGESLTAATEEVKNQIALLEQQLKEARSEQSIAARAREVEAARAQEDLNNVVRTQELILLQARQRQEAAENALSAYPEWEVYYDAKIRQDSQYQALRSDPEQEEAFRIYEETLHLSLQETWAQERKSLENAVKEAENALALAENENQAAITQAKRGVEDAGQKITDVKSGIMEMEQRKGALQKELETYQKLTEQEGQIFCGMEGTIQAIHVSSGDRTPDTAVMHLVDGSRGWVFETTLSEDELGYLNAEASVTLKFQNGVNKAGMAGGTKQLVDCPVLAATKTDDTNYLVRVEAGDGTLYEGELGTLEYTKQEGPYDCCIPASAVHTVDGKSYIFVIRETDTILGTELHVVKRQIKIVDQNDTYVALESGALGEEEQFVTGCDRELAAGDAVRPME